MEKQVHIGKKILSANEEYAAINAKYLADNEKLCLNMISSPGSGKTTILARTITDLRGQISIGVIEGDIKTELDAERIRAAQAPAVQIETQGSCHLSAPQVHSALRQLPVDDLDIIIIENVGNLVCPSAFELGENAKVVVLSVPEGDDKPAKYPGIFSKAKVLLVNKIDYLAISGFDIEKVKSDARSLNKDIEIFPISAVTGEGMSLWYEWLKSSTAKCKQ
ncbi:MAG: hydrogenase nickel incorporation protein HypB [Phycisphaerae bacterium]|nr:hydrogenase nickel incorporation protein HypB [Phycisphaerae bacterium]